ncbi:efflux RND transporter periplasmic adaptor subunit [Stenotrophomonas sp. SY1]|jgi:membrane fusion protein (multidrug efflux system)|uniref:efflux RND transporter periplasmic adaptor subunit n=1 Tax=Stenotrophomonas sp. SY1 TaxID=477235 RepID=UPI001E336970|nr:efflux RND transporter periplasmic adaptor subunit [Stenotrophomonas sp. SY1]MCD9086723.1 efflux RND transporter periplasmic adaptor subunit [Stenotrophomonas sp. SY1]
MTAPLRLLALACVATLSLAGCKKAQEQTAPPPPEVGVVDAKPQTLPLQRELVGRLSPFRSADVRARVAGVVQKRVYTEGSNVKEGQELFLIDPAPLRASLASAEAALASARASYTNARATANRARSLAPQSYVSKSDLDNAEASERSAAAAVQQAEAAVTTARINLGYARVTSPITGLAGKAQVTEGALVGQGDATLLTTVDQIDPLYVNFSMTADELSSLRAAQDKGAVALAGESKTTVQVNLPDGTPYAHEGTLDFSAPTVDPATGAVSLRAQLPNPDHTLLPGSFVSFKANLGQRNNAFLLPQQAIQRDTQGGYVMVVGKDTKVVRKNVVLDSQQGGNWLVSSGLDAGDQVIVSGVQKVKEGAPAKPMPWQPKAAAQPGAAAPAPEKKQ